MVKSPDQMPAGYVTTAQLSTFLDEPEQKIKAMAKAGILPAGQGGGHSPLATFQAYLKHMRAAAAKGTGDEAAAHLGINPRRFRELISRGIVKIKPRGEYDFAECRAAYINHLRETAAGRQGDSETILADERARKAKAEADEIEMRNKVARKEYLPRAEIDLAQITHNARVRGRLLGIPSKWAPRLLGLGSLPEIVEILTNAINEALEELAGTKVVGVLPDRSKPVHPGHASRMVGKLGASAKANGGSMGRSRT